MFGLIKFRRTAPFLNESLLEHYGPRELATLVLLTTAPSIPGSTLTVPTIHNSPAAKSRENANGPS
jgi:hypothetical protein